MNFEATGNTSHFHHASHIASKSLQITYLCITGASSADGTQWDKVPSFANKPVKYRKKKSTSETFSSQFPWRHVAHCAWVLLETLFKSPLHCFSTTCILWIFQSTACLRQTWHTDGMPWNTQRVGALSHLSLSKVTLPSYQAWFVPGLWNVTRFYRGNNMRTAFYMCSIPRQYKVDRTSCDLWKLDPGAFCKASCWKTAE